MALQNWELLQQVDTGAGEREALRWVLGPLPGILSFLAARKIPFICLLGPVPSGEDAVVSRTTAPVLGNSVAPGYTL